MANTHKNVEWSEADQALLIEMIQAGSGNKEIADTMGRTVHAIRHRILRFGLSRQVAQRASRNSSKGEDWTSNAAKSTDKLGRAIIAYQVKYGMRVAA